MLNVLNKNYNNSIDDFVRDVDQLILDTISFSEDLYIIINKAKEEDLLKYLKRGSRNFNDMINMAIWSGRTYFHIAREFEKRKPFKNINWELFAHNKDELRFDKREVKSENDFTNSVWPEDKFKLSSDYIDVVDTLLAYYTDAYETKPKNPNKEEKVRYDGFLNNLDTLREKREGIVSKVKKLNTDIKKIATNLDENEPIKLEFYRRAYFHKQLYIFLWTGDAISYSDKKLKPFEKIVEIVDRYNKNIN